MPEAPPVSSKTLFELLIKEFGSNAEYQQRVVAHIRAKFGHATLPSFHNNGTPEADKIKTYGECLAAIITHRRAIQRLAAAKAGRLPSVLNEKKELVAGGPLPEGTQAQHIEEAQAAIEKAFANLMGQVPKGQAVPTETPEVKPDRPVSRDTLADDRAEAEVEPETPAIIIEPRINPAPTMLQPPPVPPGQSNDAGALIAQALRMMQPGVSPEQVRGIVDEHLKKSFDPTVYEDWINKLIEKGIGGLRDDMAKKVDEFLGNIPARNAIEIRDGTQIRMVEGLIHWQLPQLCVWIGADVPVWLWGSAGGGKTTLAKQIGKTLDLQTLVASIDPTTTIGKLLGFRNLSTGQFVEGWLYKPYKDGGLVMLDEIDTGDPGILAALNALLANDSYMFPDGSMVERHPRFRVMAGANTKGCGAVAGYTARNRLDAATLDRFAVIELGYDEGLEWALATGEVKDGGKKWTQGASASPEMVAAWVGYVQGVRRKVGTSVLVSPRASILGARALRAGIPAKEVADACLFKLTTSDTRDNIIRSLGEFAP